MKMNRYSTKEEIFKHIKKEGQEYVQVSHKFSAGTVVKEHFHLYANEWLIFTKGKFEVSTDFKKNIVTGSDKFSFIHLPKGYIHGLTCLTDISYTVLRDGEDTITYLDPILEMRSAIAPVGNESTRVWSLYHKKNLHIAYIEVATMTEKQRSDTTYRIENGEGQLIINNRVKRVKKGDVLSVSQGDAHYFKSKKGLEVLAITHSENMVLENR